MRIISLFMLLFFISGCESQIAPPPIPDMIVFIDAHDMPTGPTADPSDEVLERVALLNRLKQHYEDHYETQMSIYPIKSQSAFMNALFSGRSQEYRGVKMSVTTIVRGMEQNSGAYSDIIGTLAFLKDNLSNQASPTIIYLSNMIHHTPEIDLTRSNRGEVDFHLFRDNFQDYIPRGNFLQGKRIIVKPVLSTTNFADGSIPSFWVNDVFRGFYKADATVCSRDIVQCIEELSLP